MNGSRQAGGPRRGFTLVELAVMIIVICVLAAFAVPRFRESAERSKAGEAFEFLSSFQAAQEQFAARHGGYAGEIDALDLEATVPLDFELGEIEAGASGSLSDSWSVTLTRTGAPREPGNYTITFTEEGFDVDRSTISSMPTINPMQT